MYLHLTDHHAPATNGAPQTIAITFLALVFFMLILPVAHVSVEDTTYSSVLLRLIKGETGFNVFALIWFIVPLAGIAVAMLAHSAWRLAAAVVALVGIIMVPLTFLTVNHSAQQLASGTEHLSPALGSYVLLVGYAILLIVSGTAAFRVRD